MTPETTQKLWDVYCNELIDNGDKTSEDVRQALATFLREIVNEYGKWKYNNYMVKSRHLSDIANLLENLK